MRKMLYVLGSLILILSIALGVMSCKSKDKQEVIVTTTKTAEALSTTAVEQPSVVVTKKPGEDYVVENSRIYFKGYTTDYKSVPQADQNMQRLDELAVLLKEVNSKEVRLVGHAVKIYWNNKPVGDREQKNKLLPLSLKRAQVIQEALIARGVDPACFKEVIGVGGDEPIVAHGDLENRWKNRRVELFLQ